MNWPAFNYGQLLLTWTVCRVSNLRNWSGALELLLITTYLSTYFQPNDTPIHCSLDHSSTSSFNPQVPNVDPPTSPTRDISHAKHDPEQHLIHSPGLCSSVESSSSFDNSTSEVTPPPERATHTRRAPRWMDDYQCKLNLCTSSYFYVFIPSIFFFSSKNPSFHY